MKVWLAERAMKSALPGSFVRSTDTIPPFSPSITPSSKSGAGRRLGRLLGLVPSWRGRCAARYARVTIPPIECVTKWSFAVAAPEPVHQHDGLRGAHDLGRGRRGRRAKDTRGIGAQRACARQADAQDDENRESATCGYADPRNSSGRVHAGTRAERATSARRPHRHRGDRHHHRHRHRGDPALRSRAGGGR